MTDIDAIRQRAKAARVIEGFPEHDHSPAALDREWLLAEVDALALNTQRLAADYMELARVNGELGILLVDATGDLDNERARIRAAVEGLPDAGHLHSVEVAGHVTRAAVVAIIERSDDA